MRADEPAGDRVVAVRRRRTALAGLVVAAVTLAGCSGNSTTPVATPSTVEAATATTSSSDGGCAERMRPEVQPSQHLADLVGPAAPFTSIPATSGVHDEDIPEAGRVAREPMEDVQIVSAVENGVVVLAVEPTTLQTMETETIDSLLAQFPDRLLVTAYDEHPMPTPVTMVSWGVLQRCETIDLVDATAFVLQERFGLVDALD